MTKKQRLLENNDIFYETIYILLFLIFVSAINFFIRQKFLKFSSFDFEILFSGFMTFFIESLIILYLFFSFPDYFKSMLNKKLNGFLNGILLYFALIPILSISVLLSIYIFEKLGFRPMPQNIVFIYFQVKSVFVLTFLFFISTVFAPIFEEILFRGFLYNALKEKFSTFFSIFISSLIFSLFHGEIFVFLGIFFLGIVLSYIFEKTGNIWVCIGLHFSNNFFANLVIFILKYRGVENLQF